MTVSAPAKAVGRNEMAFDRDTRVAPSNRQGPRCGSPFLPVTIVTPGVKTS